VDIQDIGLIVLVLIFLFIVLYIVPMIFLRRAARAVINIFRENEATNKKNAKDRAELGLLGQTVMEHMVKTKDYKPHALEFLTKIGVVKLTIDKRMYLDENMLKSLNEKKQEDKDKLKPWKFILPSEKR